MSKSEVKDDYNLQEAWIRVCGSYANTTGGIDLTKAPKYTPDEVLEQIRSKQDDDEEKNSKYQVAKDVIGKTLYCINILGGIAAQGASMVFGGPSTLCFNAVSYLIETGVNYKRIFSSLAELFRRISDVLERCKIYLRMPPGSVDIALRKIINDELLSFVSICALSTKVLKSHKIFIALKVFAFNGDEGVSAELSRLAYLVAKEDQMRGTLGFESQKTSEKAIAETKEGTKKINSTVDKVLEFEQRRDADNREKKQLGDIDANLDTPSETFKVVQGTYKGLLSKRIDGSGEWLRNDPMYTAWRDREQSSLSVLCISGGEGYGKSFLFPTIIRDLQDRYSQVPDDLTCTSVAYYFLEQESAAKGSQTADKDASSLIKALKVLAWQIVNNDLVYRKDLAPVKSVGINQINALWDLLFAKSYKTDSTFFLLFDGIDQMDRDHLKEFNHLLVKLQKMSSTWGKFCLRILLAGRDDTVDRINHLEKESSVIHVATKNGGDIEKFIKSRMSRMDILSGISTQVETLKDEILTKLTKEAHGDFINVGLLLNEIGDKQRPGEIRDVLSKSGEKRSDTIARKIERLNDTLGDDDILDLNELLTWVMYVIRPLTLAELEAVLFMKNREPSLRPLSEKINERYSALFRVLGDPDPETKMMPPTATVSLVSDSIDQYFKTKAENEAAEETRAWNETGDVSELEVRIVRRFLESVCEPKLFKKFEFESFFDRKLSRRTAKVGVDVDTAHLKIVTASTKTICSKESTELAALLEYAIYLFPAHLNEVDPSLTEPQIKAKIGPELTKLFRDEETIQRWWTDENMVMRFNWLYSDDYADTVLKWLQDSAVIKNISGEEKKWVKSLSSKSEPDADLLEHIARFLAHRWLQSADWDLSSLFCFVHGYLTKIANRKDPSVKRAMNDVGYDVTVDAAQIVSAAEWGRQQIGIDALGYEETRNLARTFREFGNPKEAIEKFKLASSMKADNWLSQWGLALTYHNQEEWALALVTLEEVKNAIECGEAKADDPLTQLPEIIRNLAAWNKEAGNDDKALQIYESVLKNEPSDYDTAFEIMSLLRKKGNFTKLLEFLEALKQSKDEKTGWDRRTQLFHTLSWNPDYHETIAVMGAHLKNFDIVKDGYQTAVNAAETKLSVDTIDREEAVSTRGVMAILLHFFALFFYNNHINDSEKQTAISLWERILGMEESESGYYNYLLSYAKILGSEKLSRVYLSKALEAETDSADAGMYIKHLEHLSGPKSDEEMDDASQIYPKQLLARYYALTGRPEKARDVLRAYIKIGIDLLSDDDPTNDWQGYKSLMMHFMYAGEDDNAQAAWSLITPEKLDEESAKTEDHDSTPTDQAVDNTDSKSQNDFEGTKQEAANKELEGPLSYRCDGRCGTNWTYANDIYVCRECHDIQFEERCLEKLRAGTLQRQVCSKDHQMFHVSKYDKEDLDRIGVGNVKVGQKISKVEDWILEIKKEWEIIL